MRKLKGQFLKKIWERVTGIEPRRLWNQLTNTQNELTNTQNELANTQNELTNTQNELANTQNELANTQNELANIRTQRQHRIHPYVLEALSLIAPELFSETKAPVDYDYETSEFTKYGSDKDERHSYGGIYMKLLEKKVNPKILEIGVGSTNDFPYAGFPNAGLPAGGGLKAFKKIFPDSYILGLDIDSESIEIIESDGFKGFVVDQTSEKSLTEVKNKLLDLPRFDLIIDDGFHDPHANLRTLISLFELLDEHGTYVIEDVHETLLDFWKMTSEFLPGKLEIVDMRELRPGVDDNILLILRKRV